MDFSPDAQLVTTADLDGAVKVFRAAATGEQLMHVSGHHKAINAAMFKPDGTAIATVSSDCDVRVCKSAVHTSCLFSLDPVVMSIVRVCLF